MQRDLRKARTEIHQHGCQCVDKRLGSHAERDLACMVAAQLLHFLLGAFAFADDRAGALQQPLAQRCQRNAAIRADKQRGAQDRFKVLQLLRDAALRDAQGARGCAQAAMFGYCLEGSQLRDGQRHMSVRVVVRRVAKVFSRTGRVCDRQR